jgi:hypothetical protein
MQHSDVPFLHVAESRFSSRALISCGCASTRYIVEPKLGRDVWLIPVEEIFHPTLDLIHFQTEHGQPSSWLHTRPVESSDFRLAVPVNVSVKLKEYT